MPATTSPDRAPDTAYWALMLSACAMGEASADFFSHGPLHMGYANASLLLGTLVVIALAAERRARVANEVRYWTTIVVMATAGTTMADFLSRSLELGYLWSSLLLGALFVITLLVWRRSARQRPAAGPPPDTLLPHAEVPAAVAGHALLPHAEVGAAARTLPATDARYWAAIMVASTLGTTLGDALTNGTALGFGGATVVLGSALVVVLAVEQRARMRNEARYWTALVLASTIGATSGDYVMKEEGLNLGYAGGIGALVALFLLIVLLRRLPGRRAPA